MMKGLFDSRAVILVGSNKSYTERISLL